MKHSKPAHVSREPLDRRRMRLIQTMLAFPAAGIIGFAGSAIVRGVVADDTSIASPATPGRTTDEAPASGEHDEPEPGDSNTIGRV